MKLSLGKSIKVKLNTIDWIADRSVACWLKNISIEIAIQWTPELTSHSLFQVMQRCFDTIILAIIPRFHFTNCVALKRSSKYVGIKCVFQKTYTLLILKYISTVSYTKVHIVVHSIRANHYMQWLKPWFTNGRLTNRPFWPACKTRPVC